MRYLHLSVLTSEKKKKNVIRYRSFFSSVFRFFSRVRFTSVSGIESWFHFMLYNIRYSGILVFVIELILLKSISSFLWVLMKKEKWKRILNWEVSSHQSRLVYWKGRGGRQWMPSQLHWICYALPTIHTITIHSTFGWIIASPSFYSVLIICSDLYHRWIE